MEAMRVRRGRRGMVIALGAAALSAFSCSNSSEDTPLIGGSKAGNGSAQGGSTSGGKGGGGTTGGSNTGGSSSGGTAGRGGTTGGAGGTGGGSGSAGRGGGSAGRGGSGGTSGGSAGGSSGSDSGGSAGDGPVLVPEGLLNPDYTTAWNPGILSDEQLGLPLGDDGVPVRTEVCATLSPGDDINDAIDGCPEGQVVELEAGEFTVSSTVVLMKGVVLRGAGSGNGGTVIRKTGGESVIRIGEGNDQSCYQGAYAGAVSLTEDAVKETTTVTVGSEAGNFAPGDIALLDEVDDEDVDRGDCTFFKRHETRGTSERVEIASVDEGAGTITLSTPLHWTFRADSQHQGQISKLTLPVVRYAGVEHLAVQGGTNPSYNGEMAGGIEISNAAYSWVKDVQTDETVAGMHVDLSGAYRVVIRDGYFHHSADYGFGADCYGIVIRCGAADNLIENNIVRYMNKPITFNVSGGGNVLGYNYADNSWADPPAYQEVNFDTHCSFPHMELMEGNWAPHMAAPTTHGNAGYLTYFRNYSSSQFASPPVAGANEVQTAGVAALSFDSGDLNMTAVGNVFGSSDATDLGTAAVSNRYECFGSDSSCIYWFPSQNDISYTSFWAHGNYDTVNDQVMWNDAIPVREIPQSLYLSGKPRWWPAGSAWPWTGSDLDPMIGTLPAKARSDAM